MADNAAMTALVELGPHSERQYTYEFRFAHRFQMIGPFDDSWSALDEGG
jgi:hypothetical protein